MLVINMHPYLTVKSNIRLNVYYSPLACNLAVTNDRSTISTRCQIPMKVFVNASLKLCQYSECVQALKIKLYAINCNSVINSLVVIDTQQTLFKNKISGRFKYSEIYK